MFCKHTIRRGCRAIFSTISRNDLYPASFFIYFFSIPLHTTAPIPHGFVHAGPTMFSTAFLVLLPLPQEEK